MLTEVSENEGRNPATSREARKSRRRHLGRIRRRRSPGGLSIAIEASRFAGPRPPHVRAKSVSYVVRQKPLLHIRGWPLC
jgi:hypothetical protein